MGARELSCPGAPEGISVWSSVWAKILWLHWLSHPAAPPHASDSSLDDLMTVLGGSQKPDHFVVYMSLDPCTPEPIKNTPKEGRVRGSEMDSQTPGRGFVASSLRGTIHAHLTKAMAFLPASHSCLPLGRRSLVRLVRWDPLGEGATTDPGLAFCSPEVQWEGRGTDRGEVDIISCFGCLLPHLVGEGPSSRPTAEQFDCQLAKFFCQNQDFEGDLQHAGPGHTGLLRPQCPWGFSSNPVSSG